MGQGSQLAIFLKTTTTKNIDPYHFHMYCPALKSGAILDLGCPSFRPSVIFRHNYRTNSIDFYQGLDWDHIIFKTFMAELWPLIYARISSPLNIFRTNRQISPNCICIYIDKI